MGTDFALDAHLLPLPKGGSGLAERGLDQGTVWTLSSCHIVKQGGERSRDFKNCLQMLTFQFDDQHFKRTRQYLHTAFAFQTTSRYPAVTVTIKWHQHLPPPTMCLSAALNTFCIHFNSLNPHHSLRGRGCALPFTQEENGALKGAYHNLSSHMAGRQWSWDAKLGVWPWAGVFDY